MKKLTLLVPFVLPALFSAACATPPHSPTITTRCKEPRPQVCTMDYRPVCGVRSDNTTKTYSNGCSACSDPQVVGYFDKECPAK